MGPAAGFDEHGDLAGHRQPRGAVRTELTHQDRIAHRLPTGRGCSHARALEGRSTRDWTCFVSIPMAVTVETRPTRSRSSTAEAGRARPDLASEGAFK